ncbi:FAD-dependent oxidoreductase [Arthrobacter sp. I2-34]|uniref:FAD-dependent oxidoreductase n=1 Tax=Arthrobacter hankyongi TaxID=2904801 RepID=A0ABS9L5H9_9MICC|nr:FAD-dependent oxidoreductase [Arthrobacter hankyongi]MCG2621927.1 FAD-dependent oxidoreductase [Arthrobacter hankyongi]
MNHQAPERIAVVGFGPVAARLVDELLPAVRAGRVLLTVIGSESAPAYNRVLVADLGVGRTTPEDIELADADELRAAGVNVRLGRTVRRIDRPRRRIELDDGSHDPYDRLVLATGAGAIVPTLTGLNPDPAAVHLLPPGVTALRDLADAARLRETVHRGGHVIVLGGGILGIEAALAAAEEGARVTVVHNGDRPLARNIDHGGGKTLARTLRAAGIDLVSGARSTGVRFLPQAGGRHRFEALELEDGRRIDGDLLLLSCGIRPRTGLAEGAGLPVAKGILVSHRLEADKEGTIFAIGDCAEVRCTDPACAGCSGPGGGPAGLIGPGWRQAEWLARRLVPQDPSAAGTGGADGAPAQLAAERPGVMLLKARNVDMASAGAVEAELWDDEVGSGGCGGTIPPRQVAQWADPEHGRYVKMVTRGGVLEGLVCVGMPRTAAELVLLYERGSELPADRTALFRLDAAEQLPDLSGPADPAASLCRCTGATHGQVQEAVAGGCHSPGAVGDATRAGTGCGGCRSRIVDMIEAHLQSAGAATGTS